MTSAVTPTNAPVRLGSVSEQSPEALRFLQDRIALFAKVAGLLSTVFYLTEGFLSCTELNAFLWSGGRAWHAASTAVMLGTWLIARRRTIYTGPTLSVLDGSCLLLTCFGFIVMGKAVEDLQALTSVLLALFAVTVTRAIVVPSSPVRSLMLTSLALAPYPFTVWLGLMAKDVQGFGQPLVAPTPEQMFTIILFKSLWVGTIITIVTVASKVVYGLHEKVREARQLGQYTLQDKIGEGGMGKVYRASHAMLRRPTALKLLEGDGLSDSQLRRFEREVQLTSMLTHAHTISVYDYGRTPDGIFYYAMEFLDGVNLEELVQRDGPQSPARVIYILRQVAGALAEAHGLGLIHRDIKPANIFLCERGGEPDFVKVLDFGLVKELDQSDDINLTNMNVITGTPLYLSPESITAPDTADGRSDLYALGAVGYFLLTGENVFAGESVVEVCGHHLHTKPLPPSERIETSIPNDLEEVLLQCLEKSPSDRPTDARDFEAKLSRCGSVRDWTRTEAQVWWQAYREAEERRPEVPRMRHASKSPRTVAVDIDARILAPPAA